MIKKAPFPKASKMTQSLEIILTKHVVQVLLRGIKENITK